MTDVQLIADTKNVLGEGPIWCPIERVLYRVDNLDPKIHRYDPATGSVQTWPMPEEIGSMVLREGSGIVAAMKSGFCFIDLETGKIDPIVDPEPDKPDNRMNDGKCDRRGRYWCGSMNSYFPATEPTAALYKLDPDLGCYKMDEGYIISNGMAWSPDDRTMYFADTRADIVFAYDFDIDTGTISNRRNFISTADTPGRADGATVDAEGFYWCAHVWDWSVVRYDPKGREDRRIRFPVRNVTCVAFGGDNLDVLYVTSSTARQPAEDLASQPMAGGLMAIDVGVKGLPEPRFAG